MITESEPLDWPSAKGLLSPDEYRLLAGPALKAAAQVAATRGDPDLFHDMASMLALLAMVTALTHYYQAGPAAGRQELESIPIAVCALVFTRSGLAPDEVRDCLSALPQAYGMLVDAGALDPRDASMAQAFAALRAGEADRADELLLQAAHAMASAVDQWEEEQSRAADQA